MDGDEEGGLQAQAFTFLKRKLDELGESEDDDDDILDAGRLLCVVRRNQEIRRVEREAADAAFEEELELQMAAEYRQVMDRPTRPQTACHSLFSTCVRKLEALKPGVGRGKSAANANATHFRRPHVHPEGIDAWLGSLRVINGLDGHRQWTGFSQPEFEVLFAGQGGENGHLFAEPRNIHGSISRAENKERRNIRGSLCPRDRVLCWLIMLRQGYSYREMETLFGPGQSTFCRDLLWMTMQAQTCTFLNNEVTWPPEVERRRQRDWLETSIHPAFRNVAYTADGTKAAAMRQPGPTRKGVKSQRLHENQKHFSFNKGLGWSHILYTDMRGRIIRVETIEGRMSDRAAHNASRVYQHPEEFLAPGEVGMGDGNYQGLARMDSSELFMCVPHKKTANMSAQHWAFNSVQRRIRVVVENTIGQVKMWKIVGKKTFTHTRDFEPAVFECCTKLTALVMRLRNKYPRSEQWVWENKEEWEARLGVFLYLDYEEPEAYLVHGLGEDMLYETSPAGAATLCQERWNTIWAEA